MSITYYDTYPGEWIAQVETSSRITQPTGTPGPYYGASKIQIECRENDNVLSGDQPLPNASPPKPGNKRAEIYLPTEVCQAYQNTVQWWAFTLVGVSGTIETGAHTFRHQWHGPNGTGQAQVAINTDDGKVNVRLWDAGTGTQTNHQALASVGGAALTFANLIPYHFLQRIVHSTDPEVGRVEMWCNGVKFVDRFLQTIYTKRTDGTSLPTSEYRNYIKNGYYAQDTAGTITTAIDGTRRGTADETFATMIADFPVGSGYTGSTGGGGSGGGTTTRTVSFLSPAAAATLTGTVEWRADATAVAPRTVASVRFYVDDVLILTETSPPYGDTAGHWNSASVADGSRTLKLVMTDSAGGTAEATRTVTVDNVAEPSNPDPTPVDPRYGKTRGEKVAGGKVAGSKTAGTKITTVAQEEATESATLGTTPILDTFIRANEGPPPSASWTTGITSGDGGLKVVSNECQGDTSANNSGYWSASSPGPDCEVYVALNNKGVSGAWCWVGARLADVGTATPDGYLLRFDAAAGTDTLRLFRMTNGALTQIGTSYETEFAVNDRMLLRCVGSTITAAKATQSGGWEAVIEATDATHAGAGRIGLYCRGGTADFAAFGGGTVGS